DDGRPGAARAAFLSEVGARGALRGERRGDDARPEAGVRAVRAVRAQAAGVLGPPALGSACLIPVLLSPILGSALDTWAPSPSPSARSEPSPTRCSETSSSQRGADPSWSFGSTALATTRSSSGRREDSTQSAVGCR